jgi:E3 ubiquitin-protein ligase SIS3
MCAVCHDDLAVGQYELRFRECGHSFHPGCLNQWLDRRRTCPCCRAMLDHKKAAKDCKS